MATFLLILSAISFWTTMWIMLRLSDRSSIGFETASSSRALSVFVIAFALSSGAISSTLDMAWYWATLLNLLLFLVLGSLVSVITIRLFSSGSLLKDYVQLFLVGLILLIVGFIMK